MDTQVSVSSSHLDTIPRLVQFWAESVPDREMFVFYNGDVRQPYTCKQVFQNAGKFANRLRNEYRFQKGDIIATTLPNSPERLITDLGIILAGCICVNCMIVSADVLEFLTAVEIAGCRAVIVCPETTGWKLLETFVTGNTTSSVVSLECDKTPMMKSAILVSRNRKNFLQDLESSSEDIFVDPNIQPNDIVYAFNTTGSTAQSKHVPHIHEDVIHNRRASLSTINQQRQQAQDISVSYNDRPFAWLGGSALTTYVTGKTRILLDLFDTQGSKVGPDVWKIICQEKVDYAVILPPDLHYMLTHTACSVDYKLKLIGTGGMPILKHRYEQYKRVAHEVAIAYASTEAGMITVNILQDTDVKDFFCGPVMPGMEVRIVDEQGRECSSGHQGVIHVRGKGVFKGYLNHLKNPDPKIFAVFTKDGWLNTEDIGYFDHHKNLYVLGRYKDVINYGAILVSPSWLERQIIEHPEVQDACVVPVSDPVLFKNICAVVKLVPGSNLREEELKTFCNNLFLQSKEVEGTPIPEYYLILDDFPTHSNGKVARAAIQKIAEETFGIK